jgi:hypothetical protein
MAEAIRRDIEIRLRAIDDTAAGVNSASRNVARVGQAADRSGEIGLAPIRRAPGYSRLEQEVRDAQAAELRAIRVQTARAEMQARQEYARSIARENLGLSSASTVAQRNAAMTAARVAASGGGGGGGVAGVAANAGLLALARRGLRLPAGAGPAFGALAIATAAGKAADAVTDFAATDAYSTEREELKAGYRDTLRSIPGIRSIGRGLDLTPGLRNPRNVVARLAGTLTDQEEKLAKLEEAAVQERIAAVTKEIEAAKARRKTADEELFERRRDRLSRMLGPSFDAAQRVRDFDQARSGKKKSAEEWELRGELVDDARAAREVDVYNRLDFDRGRDNAVRGYFADQQQQRVEREAEVADRQRRADEEMAIEAQRERERQVVVARRRSVMQAMGRVDMAGDSLGRAQSAYALAEAAAPVRVGNDLTGDAGALFGIQSTGKDSSAAMLNRLADEVGKQTTVFNQVLGELKQLRKLTEEQELL